MIRVLEQGTRVWDGMSRREALRLGGVGAFSLWGGLRPGPGAAVSD